MSGATRDPGPLPALSVCTPTPGEPTGLLLPFTAPFALWPSSSSPKIPGAALSFGGAPGAGFRGCERGLGARGKGWRAPMGAATERCLAAASKTRQC